MGNLYTPMKIFHFQQKLDSLLDPEQCEAPLHIRIKPTNRCNHNCAYCAYRVDNLQLGKDMSQQDMIPAEKMHEITEDIIDMGVKAVTFSGGGEPLIYPYLLPTLKQLAQANIPFATLTNGACLSGEIAEMFAHHGVWVRVSIDGWDGPSYATYRNVSTSMFEQVLNNMAAFKKLAGNCFLGISLIIDEKNAAHVYGMIERLHGIGVDSVKVSPCVISNQGSENNAYHRPLFAQVKEQIERAESDFVNEQFEIFDAYHELDERFEKDYDWCPYCQILPVIGADQNVYSCQDKAYNLESGLLGSIKEVRFKEFWMAEKTKFFKIKPSRDCSHHCVAHRKNCMVLEYLAADQDHLGFV